MVIIDSKVALGEHLSSLVSENNTLGLVPTMGALHQGHIALVTKAFNEHSVVVVSIFINPTQFNNNDDLEKYPKTFDEDISLLTGVSENIIVFAPSVSEIYPEHVTSKNYDFDGLDKVMEGAFREGHFNGVGTIVEELLRIVKPHMAYFGEKDFQQLQIIRKMVAQRSIPVTIIGCPIVRESNGLAMSSRNERLSETLRQKASIIYKTLKTAKIKFGTNSAFQVIAWVKDKFENHPEFQLEYFEITDVETLTPVVKKQKNKNYRAFIAVYAKEVRLIDNIAL